VRISVKTAGHQNSGSGGSPVVDVEHARAGHQPHVVALPAPTHKTAHTPVNGRLLIDLQHHQALDGAGRRPPSVCWARRGGRAGGHQQPRSLAQVALVAVVAGAVQGLVHAVERQQQPVRAFPSSIFRDQKQA
jgi:hypothetical protein